MTCHRHALEDVLAPMVPEVLKMSESVIYPMVREKCVVVSFACCIRDVMFLEVYLFVMCIYCICGRYGMLRNTAAPCVC